MHRLLFIIFIALPSVLHAQSYPNYTSTFINDQANLIDEATEEELSAALDTLKTDTGIEATIVTLESWESFGGHNNIESFATGLFNHWGVGNAETNDGIMILVTKEERSMRIELGSGYRPSYNDIASSVIETSFVPSFRADNYNDGIKNGTMAVIDQIAYKKAGMTVSQPLSGDTSGEAENGGSNIMMWIAGVGAAIVGGIVWLVKKGSIKNKPCPNCGQKRLQRTSETLSAATTSSTGEGRHHTWCDNCDYDNTEHYTISRKSQTRTSSSSGGGSFGGGSSSGGGASGKW